MRRNDLYGGTRCQLDTGEEFLKGLRARNREVWLGDERVDDVTTHPQLEGAAHSLASVFDVQHEFPDDCLMPDPETGEAINVSHMIPRSIDDLKRRHRGLRRIAELTVGIMGRTPDYMNVTFAGFAGERGAWLGPEGKNVEGHDNLIAYQKMIAREDLSLTHTIVHPTIDRVKDQSFAGNPVPLHKVGETSTGIIVRGARILATLAPFADEMTVYPGSSAAGRCHRATYALSFALPMDTPGLIFLCRDSAATVGSNSLRPSAVVEVRRAGRVRDLRRRRGAPRAGLHRRRHRRVQLGDGTDRVVGQHHAADHDSRAHQAGVRLRARAAHGRGGQRQLARRRSRCWVSCRRYVEVTRSCDPAVGGARLRPRRRRDLPRRPPDAPDARRCWRCGTRGCARS